MTVAIDSEGRGCLTVDITGVASAAAGGQGEVSNPEGVSLLIKRMILYVQAASTGAANISVGIAASGGAFTDAINALAVNAVAGKVYNGSTLQGTTKTEITVPAVWTTALVLGITASASMVGFVGKLFVEYYRLA